MARSFHFHFTRNLIKGVESAAYVERRFSPGATGMPFSARKTFRCELYRPAAEFSASTFQCRGKSIELLTSAELFIEKEFHPH